MLDDLLGKGFAIVYRGLDWIAAYDPQTREFFDRLGTTVARVDDLPDGGALARLLDNARADALLLLYLYVAAAGQGPRPACSAPTALAGINPAESPQEVRNPR